jgi:hypothetical protein
MKWSSSAKPGLRRAVAGLAGSADQTRIEGARKISAAAPAASAGERAKPAHRHARRSGRAREGSAAQRWSLLDHGCRVCIQSAAACALLAAVKIARGSSLSSCSQEAM